MFENLLITIDIDKVLSFYCTVEQHFVLYHICKWPVSTTSVGSNYNKILFLKVKTNWQESTSTFLFFTWSSKVWANQSKLGSIKLQCFHKSIVSGRFVSVKITTHFFSWRQTRDSFDLGRQSAWLQPQHLSLLPVRQKKTDGKVSTVTAHLVSFPFSLRLFAPTSASSPLVRQHWPINAFVLVPPTRSHRWRGRAPSTFASNAHHLLQLSSFLGSLNLE